MYSSLSSDNCPIGAQVWQVFMRNHTGTTSGMPGLPVTDSAGASLPGWRLPSHVQQHSALSTSWCFDLCMVLRTLSSYGNRFFAAAGPRLLSTLPVQLCNPDITCGLFRWQLKGHFFGKHEHGALTLLIRGAIEKHLLTYLQHQSKNTTTENWEPPFSVSWTGARTWPWPRSAFPVPRSRTPPLSAARPLLFSPAAAASRIMTWKYTSYYNRKHWKLTAHRSDNASIQAHTFMLIKLWLSVGPLV